MDGINGWLLIYLIGSLPVIAFYSAGLSGWFFDYPVWLFAAIFLVLLVPLVLLVLKVPSAPAWNIAGLWIGGGLISARVIYGLLLGDAERLKEHWQMLALVVVFAIAWAIVWTWYFLTSERVANTYS